MPTAAYLIQLRTFQPVVMIGLRLTAQLAVSAILALVVAFLTSLAPAFAARGKAAAVRFVTPGEMKSGALLLQSTQEGRYVEAPRLGTDVDLTVSGPTIRARVTQIFHNPTENWVEGVYVYPLPEGAAVDTMKMVIGDRVVVADIKERQRARVIYEEAKASGQKAALVEQERPNIFTNSVANLGPGESVVVQIEYQEPVRQSGDTFSLRVPLVVGPRYNPAPIVHAVDIRPGSSGWGSMDPVPDPSRIEPPVLDPRDHTPVNPVSITVRLNAGFPLAQVKSHHHTVKSETGDNDVRVIKLAEGQVPADRDFELTWQPVAGKSPSVGVFKERVGDADYLLTYITPPALGSAEDRRPREIVFVIDNSGSMGGTSMAQAKAGLIYGLGRLRPSDRFNVIRFDNTMDMLFSDSVPADAENVARAKGFVGSLEARGGTEMVQPMRAALNDPRKNDSTFLRQVVFLTDGAIGNEQQLFDTISGLRGRSRVFMVGIGSAPNTFLMNRASELGRGTFTHISSAEQVEARMKSLFEKLESPAVTNLSVTLPGKVDMTPAVLPDLYRGEPLVLSARLGTVGGTLEVKGTIGDQPWSVAVPLANAAEGKGLSKLWARRKIADAEVGRSMRTIGPEDADRTILALALEHHLVTRLTSLVAVDQTPSRPAGERLSRADIPLNLPAGWDFDKVFGERPSQRAPDSSDTDMRKAQKTQQAPQQLALARYTSAVAARPAPVAGVRSLATSPRPQTVTLPKTATDAELRIIFGLILLSLSLLLIVLRRRMPLRAV